MFSGEWSDNEAKPLQTPIIEKLKAILNLLTLQVEISCSKLFLTTLRQNRDIGITKIFRKYF